MTLYLGSGDSESYQCTFTKWLLISQSNLSQLQAEYHVMLVEKNSYLLCKKGNELGSRNKIFCLKKGIVTSNFVLWVP